MEQYLKDITALVIIDMQESYVGTTQKRKIYNTDILLVNINNLIKQYENSNQLIVYIKNKGKHDTSDLVKGLSVSSENIFLKEKANCFSIVDFSNFVDSHKIKTFEIVGIDGNSCIAISALSGVKLGYHIMLNLKCIGIANVSRFESTTEKLLLNNVEII